MWTYELLLHFHWMEFYRANKNWVVFHEVFRIHSCDLNLRVLLKYFQLFFICENIYLVISNLQSIEGVICLLHDKIILSLLSIEYTRYKSCSFLSCTFIRTNIKLSKNWARKVFHLFEIVHKKWSYNFLPHLPSLYI